MTKEREKKRENKTDKEGERKERGYIVTERAMKSVRHTYCVVTTFS